MLKNYRTTNKILSAQSNVDCSMNKKLQRDLSVQAYSTYPDFENIWSKGKKIIAKKKILGYNSVISWSRGNLYSNQPLKTGKNNMGLLSNIFNYFLATTKYTKIEKFMQIIYLYG